MANGQSPASAAAAAARRSARQVAAVLVVEERFGDPAPSSQSRQPEHEEADHDQHDHDDEHQQREEWARDTRRALEEPDDPVADRLHGEVERVGLRAHVLGLGELVLQPPLRLGRVGIEWRRLEQGVQDHVAGRSLPAGADAAGAVDASVGTPYGSPTGCPASRCSTNRWSSRSRPSLRMRRSM